MSAATPLFNPTLESVAQAFDHWRATRSKRSRTPVSLQRRAAALLCSHRASHICRALKVNDIALKRWAADSSSASASPSVAHSSSSFIELPALPASVDSHTPELGCTALSVELGDGMKLHVDGHFTLEQILDTARQFKQGVRS